MGLFRPFTNAPVVLAVVVATAPLKSKVHVKPPEDKWNLKPIIWLRSDWIQAKHSVDGGFHFPVVQGGGNFQRAQTALPADLGKISPST